MRASWTWAPKIGSSTRAPTSWSSSHPERVTALALEPLTHFRAAFPEVRVVRYDGQRFPFAENAFDAVFCNAVLEHVGSRQGQESFLAELFRVARVGLVSTPNRWFPVEVHTRLPLLHYLPKRQFDPVLRLLGKGWAAGRYMHLLGKRDLARLARAAGMTCFQIRATRVLGMPMVWALVFWKSTETRRGDPTLTARRARKAPQARSSKGS